MSANNTTAVDPKLLHLIKKYLASQNATPKVNDFITYLTNKHREYHKRINDQPEYLNILRAQVAIAINRVTRTSTITPSNSSDIIIASGSVIGKKVSRNTCLLACFLSACLCARWQLLAPTLLCLLPT